MYSRVHGGLNLGGSGAKALNKRVLCREWQREQKPWEFIFTTHHSTVKVLAIYRADFFVVCFIHSAYIRQVLDTVLRYDSVDLASCSAPKRLKSACAERRSIFRRYNRPHLHTGQSS